MRINELHHHSVVTKFLGTIAAKLKTQLKMKLKM